MSIIVGQDSYDPDVGLIRDAGVHICSFLRKQERTISSVSGTTVPVRSYFAVAPEPPKRHVEMSHDQGLHCEIKAVSRRHVRIATVSFGHLGILTCRGRDL